MRLLDFRHCINKCLPTEEFWKYEHLLEFVPPSRYDHVVELLMRGVNPKDVFDGLGQSDWVPEFTKLYRNHHLQSMNDLLELKNQHEKSSVRISVPNKTTDLK
jgi:hypothetical protein